MRRALAGIGSILVLAAPAVARAASIPSLPTIAPLPSLQIAPAAGTSAAALSPTLEILGIVSILAVAPGILVLMTSFTRIVVVLGFLRSALGTQNIPPNSVLLGLALFLTFFVMAPVFGRIDTTAVTPFEAGRITEQVALQRAITPVRSFMFHQTRPADVALMMSLARLKPPRTARDVPTYALIPAFAISELRSAFIMGFVLFLPFLIIDLVVASTLMSVGMLFLPPTLVSLPFKILLFVLVNGWGLVVQSLVQSFH